MEQTLLKLIEVIKNLSPDIWRILLKQVNNEIMTELIWIVILVAMLIVIPFMIRKLKKQFDENETNEAVVILYIFSIAVELIFSLILIILITSVFRMINNPEFYAIDIFIKSILKPY